MTDTKLLFFAGSARTRSLNKKLARLGTKIASDAGISATFIDLRDFEMPIYDGDLEEKDGVPEMAKSLISIIAAHDGIFISTPEYNSLLSPLLKNTIDWISRVRLKDTGGTAFKHMPIALGSATAGATGGVRAMLSLRQTLCSGIAALVLSEQMSVPKADDAFDADGNLKDTGSEAHFISVIKRLHDVAAKGG